MNKFKTKEIVALIIIGLLIISTAVVGGIVVFNNINKENEKANKTGMETVETVELETKSSEDEKEGEEVTASADNKADETQKATDSTSNSKGDKNSYNKDTSNKNTEKSTKPAKNDKDNANNNVNEKPDISTNNQSNNNNDGQIQVVVPETNETHSTRKTLKVNGVDCYVGDTITVVLNLETPDVLMNFQGYTKYDKKYLKFDSVKGNVSGGMFNDHESCIYYNGSNINTGYDFTKNGTLYTAKFKVLKEGNTGIVNTVEVMTDMDDKIVHPKDGIFKIGIYN